jgi:hypothetical protein
MHHVPTSPAPPPSIFLSSLSPPSKPLSSLLLSLLSSLLPPPSRHHHRHHHHQLTLTPTPSSSANYATSSFAIPTITIQNTHVLARLLLISPPPSPFIHSYTYIHDTLSLSFFLSCLPACLLVSNTKILCIHTIQHCAATLYNTVHPHYTILCIHIVKYNQISRSVRPPDCLSVL